MLFNYEGFTARGEAKVGSQEAESESHAAEILREKGIFVREFSTKEIDTKYDHAPRAMDDDVGETSTPIVPDDVAEQALATAKRQRELETVLRKTRDVVRAQITRSQTGTGESTWWEEALRDRLSVAAEVVRRMDTWKKAYKEKEGTYDGPDLGGKSWDLYSPEETMSRLIESAVDGVVNRMWVEARESRQDERKESAPPIKRVSD